MPRSRRSVNIFTFSFLDAMACGFGASVLLFFMIIKNVAPEQLRNTQEDMKSEVTRIELEHDSRHARQCRRQRSARRL